MVPAPSSARSGVRKKTAARPEMSVEEFTACILRDGGPIVTIRLNSVTPDVSSFAPAATPCARKERRWHATLELLRLQKNATNDRTARDEWGMLEESDKRGAAQPETV